MSNTVILDNVEHHDLKVNLARGDAFGDNVNQALVFPNEFRELQREYPIFFRKDAEGAFQAVAILGLDKDENLYLNGTDWNARYIPAVLARGPFSMVVASDESGQPTDPKIQIDLNNPSVGKDDGVPIFLPHGGHSKYLDHILGVMRTLHEGLAYSKAFFAALQEQDLIEEVTVEIKVNDGLQYSVPAVYSISQEKFQNLSAEVLRKFHQSGFLAPCYWVLSSLDNINLLVDTKTRKK
jgi:hypothetical protein